MQATSTPAAGAAQPPDQPPARLAEEAIGDALSDLNDVEFPLLAAIREARRYQVRPDCDTYVALAIADAESITNVLRQVMRTLVRAEDALDRSSAS